MAYHVYTTKGIVLGAFASREADRIYSILTEELGLVRARARSVRAIQSKLRGALEPYSLSDISLVRGKDSWRITGAALVERLDEEHLGKAGLLSFSKVFSLLEKLVAGEEAHKELMRVLEDGLEFVYSNKEETKVESVEILLVLRLLNELGYISSTDIEPGFIKGEFTAELLAKTEKDKKKLVEAINHGLHSSNLV
jgi:DNA repair protein RecO (recombination protein O)